MCCRFRCKSIQQEEGTRLPVFSNKIFPRQTCLECRQCFWAEHSFSHDCRLLLLVLPSLLFSSHSVPFLALMRPLFFSCLSVVLSSHAFFFIHSSITIKYPSILLVYLPSHHSDASFFSSTNIASSRRFFLLSLLLYYCLSWQLIISDWKKWVHKSSSSRAHHVQVNRFTNESISFFLSCHLLVSSETNKREKRRLRWAQEERQMKPRKCVDQQTRSLEFLSRVLVLDLLFSHVLLLLSLMQVYWLWCRVVSSFNSTTVLLDYSPGGGHSHMFTHPCLREQVDHENETIREGNWRSNQKKKK